MTDAAGQRISSHFFGQSSFGTYANVVETSLVKVPDTYPLEVLAPLGCGLNTGAGAVLNELRPPAGSSFVVTGAGAVGLAAIMAAKIAGCTTIVAVDRYGDRLTLAKELGATHIVAGSDEPLDAQLLEMTNGVGVDYVLDTTAVPAVLSAAAKALAIRGTLALVGAAAPGTEVSFEIGLSLVKGWTFKTIIQGSSVPQEFIPRLIELWAQGRFPFDKLIKSYPLGRINDAFADSKSGRVVKPVVVF